MDQTRLFFINTDAASNKGISRHAEWFRQDVVLTSGEDKYRRALARIPVNARVLVYANSVGVVALGVVTSDEILNVMPPNTISPAESVEYHRKVRWVLDLRGKPIGREELKELIGQGPLQTVQEVHKGTDQLLKYLAELEAQPTAEYLEYLRVAAELSKGGAVERPAGVLEPDLINGTKHQRRRCPRVRAWTLQRAQGVCELCCQQAPFLDDQSERYLETHHITRLADNGPDTPENAAAVCPNCHRELHFGVDRKRKSADLKRVIAKKEAKYKTELDIGNRNGVNLRHRE